MQKFLRYFCLIIIILLANEAVAQELSNLRSKPVKAGNLEIKFDSLSVIPGTLIVKDFSNKIINSNLYSVNYLKSEILFDQTLANKTFTLEYKVFYFDISKPYFHKSIDSVNFQSDNFNNNFVYKPNSGGLLDFPDSKLKRQGSISRGISFGNNQDVIVNSSLNLQLSGQLSSDLEIVAAITDNNIPIQPDGTSQQIQEFDKVFISVFNSKINLTVGDFEVKKPSGYFMNLNKKVQGASFTNISNFKGEKEASLKTSVSGAVAKGKYNRMAFTGMEGNQGPYKLTGANNELYIIILAGTERVFLDGKLLTRGQENDYVIDYNTAELSFTPKNPITKDRRIVVEFEYSDKNYARFMVHNSNEFKNEKMSLRLNIFSEQDSKNQPLQQDLSDLQKEFLSQIGDSVHLAVFPNIDSMEFDNSYVLYKKTDSIVGGVNYSDIYIYSTNPDSAFYRLGFSQVGQSKGNYVQEISSANGKVYKWVAPVSGIPQGNYEPVVLLVTPKKKQMLTLGGTYGFTKNSELEIELGITANDPNTFSGLHNEDNTGFSLRTSYLQKIPLRDSLTKLSSKVLYMYIDKQFDPVERFRNAEFERDWNLDSKKLDEHFLQAGIGINKVGKYKTTYDIEIMNRGLDFSAYKNNLDGFFTKSGFRLDFSGSYLKTNQYSSNSDFLRQKTAFYKTISSNKIGVRTELEDNKWYLKSNDSLLGNSFSFFQYEVFSESADTTSNGYFVSYKNRSDQLPNNNKLINSSIGEDFSGGFKLLKNQNSRLQTSVNYRKLQISDTTITDQQQENSVTGRIDYTAKFFKSAIVSSTFIETGSGMELKKEYSYLEVSPGQGVYAWTDYNSNGIKELDEFEIAAFQDQAAYIRIYTPTNDYIRTANNQFSQQLNIMPSKIWRKAEGFKKFIGKFSNQFAYRINKKKLSEDIFSNINPFIKSANDTGLISFGNSIRNSFSFNRSSPVFGADIIIQENSNRILLLNGLDTRTANSTGLQIRWNITKSIMLVDKISQGLKTYDSEFFSSKNYEISSVDNSGALQFQSGTTVRLTISHAYSLKSNNLGVEKAEKNDLGLEFRYNVVNKGSLMLAYNYIYFDYNSPANTSIAYTMLEGLLPGTNSTWTAGYQRNLSNGLQLNINYSGRKSEESKMVHIGGVQLRAYF
ncbi:MAG: hypothetical protein JXR58_05655 [Bacteroidales bacterium]|nr:hypothetical protein [Bacteroidales bacterium]